MLGKSSSFLVLLSSISVFHFNGYFKSSKPLLSPVVETANGNIRGIISVSRDGRRFYEYLGIPYATPPINELRYEPPMPPSSWIGIRDAKEYGAECAQLNRFIGGVVTGYEDCLFLNVFTPNLPIINETLLPTMVWMPGGLFAAGSSNMYRSDFFMDEDVVLVTLNYRLAALGFLSTGDGVVLGNMGLKDQSMALRWVKQNIHKFGGDPNQVTIFGESAGGASVHLHMMSNMSEGLFNRAISQSGVALNPWVILSSELQLPQVQRYAKNVNCLVGDTKQIVDCLKKKPIEELLEGHRESIGNLRKQITLFRPVVEIQDPRAFLSEHPRNLTRNGKAHRVPWMVGYNSHEGLMTSPDIVRDDELLKMFDEQFNDMMPDFMFYPARDRKSTDVELQKIRDFYFGSGERINSRNKMDNFTNLFTDWDWGFGVDESAKLQSAFSPVYPYYYAYKGRFAFANILLALNGKYPAILELSWFFISKWISENIFNVEIRHYGSCHGDEMTILFPLTGLSEIRQGHPDYKFSKGMVKLWAAFASNQNPALPLYNGQSHTWKPNNQTSEKIHYLKIDAVPEIISHPHPERIAFWDKLRS